jgi:hypothetical protein
MILSCLIWVEKLFFLCFRNVVYLFFTARCGRSFLNLQSSLIKVFISSICFVVNLSANASVRVSSSWWGERQLVKENTCQHCFVFASCWLFPSFYFNLTFCMRARQAYPWGFHVQHMRWKSQNKGKKQRLISSRTWKIIISLMKKESTLKCANTHLNINLLFRVNHVKTFARSSCCSPRVKNDDVWVAKCFCQLD